MLVLLWLKSVSVLLRLKYWMEKRGIIRLKSDSGVQYYIG